MRRLAPLALLVLTGCPFDSAEQACTLQFQQYRVRVLDAAGRPVTDASVDVRRVRTGESLICSSEGQRDCVRRSPREGTDGLYTVYDDGVRPAEGGEDVRVVATRGASRAEAVHRYRFDGCHVEKVAGPTDLVLAP